MNDYAIVTLSGYLDIFLQHWLSCERYEPTTRKILVASGQCRGVQQHGWTIIDGEEPFSFPRNANIGMREAAPADVFLVNDDVTFTEACSVRRLAMIAHEHPEVGILSPQFEGLVGNALQERRMHPTDMTLIESGQRLCFTGVYIRRAVLDVVGELDERFDGYGREDDDYCRRVRAAGLTLAVTPEVVMRHGFRDAQHSASFRRLPSYPKSGIDPEMTKRYLEKWGDLK